MKKLIYTLTGAGVALASVSAVAGYAIGKNKDKDPSAAILVAGIAGMVAGAAIAVVPEVLQLRKKILSADAEMAEEELDLIDEEITEVLGAEEDEAETVVAEEIAVEAETEA